MTTASPLQTTRRRPISSLFDEFFDDFLAPFASGTERRPTSMPALNVAETDRQYRLAFELPGIKREDVSVQLDDDQLVVSAERRFESEKQEGDHYHRVEHRYGRFARSLSLPKDVDPDSVEATFENGVLTVTVNKQEPTQARRIEIKGQ